MPLTDDAAYCPPHGVYGGLSILGSRTAQKAKSS